MNNLLSKYVIVRGALLTFVAFIASIFWSPSEGKFSFRSLTLQEWTIVSTALAGYAEIARGRGSKENEVISLSTGVDSEEKDGADLLSNFRADKASAYLVAKHDTYLKTSISQSFDLNEKERELVKEGDRIDVESWSFLPEKNSHIEINSNFYVFSEHFDLYNSNNLKIDIERASSPTPIVRKNLTPLFLPGLKEAYLEDPIYEGSNFFWYEATKNGTRIPESKTIVSNIISQAKLLDALRKANGNKPLIVTSWYRDPITNKAVGGANRSDHLTGRSTDLFCPSMSIWEFQKFCLSYWKHGGVGRGASRGFVHLSSDLNYRVWDY